MHEPIKNGEEIETSGEHKKSLRKDREEMPCGEATPIHGVVSSVCLNQEGVTICE